MLRRCCLFYSFVMDRVEHRDRSSHLRLDYSSSSSCPIHPQYDTNYTTCWDSIFQNYFPIVFIWLARCLSSLMAKHHLLISFRFYLPWSFTITLPPHLTLVLCPSDFSTSTTPLQREGVLTETGLCSINPWSYIMLGWLCYFIGKDSSQLSRILSVLESYYLPVASQY